MEDHQNYLLDKGEMLYKNPNAEPWTHEPFWSNQNSRTMAWRKPGQGFEFGLTGKISHIDGGNVSHLIGATAYRKDVITEKHVEYGRINVSS